MFLYSQPPSSEISAEEVKPVNGLVCTMDLWVGRDVILVSETHTDMGRDARLL